MKIKWYPVELMERCGKVAGHCTNLTFTLSVIKIFGKIFITKCRYVFVISDLDPDTK